MRYFQQRPYALPTSVSDYAVSSSSPIANIQFINPPGFHPHHHHPVQPHLVPHSILKKNYQSLNSPEMTGSQISTAGSSNNNNAVSKEDQIVKNKIRFSQAISLCMAVSSILLAILSLHMYLDHTWDRMKPEAYKQYKKYVVILRECTEAAEVAVIAISLTAFFFSTLQLFFSLKFLKTHPLDPEIALTYIEKSSFLRMIIYSFWFLSVLIFIIVMLVSCTFDMTRGVYARGIAVALGMASLLFCAIASLWTVHYWNKALYNGATTSQYKNLSTLV